jgi:hypothetical protein
MSEFLIMAPRVERSNDVSSVIGPLLRENTGTEADFHAVALGDPFREKNRQP